MDIVEIPDNNSCLLFSNFLTEEENSAIYRYAVNSPDLFSASKVGGIENGFINETYRKSKVLRSREGKQGFKQLLRDRVKPMVPEVLNKLGLPGLSKCNFEIDLTSHNHGDFYKPHADNGKEHSKRVLSFVYYFCSNPKVFTGGQLLFLNNKPMPLIIEPENNAIVFFNSSLLHAVHPVSCPDQKFEHSRFTLNGWVLNITEGDQS